ncbi:MAG: cyclase family protein [Solirubrobacteraceae bacterium]
MADAPAGSNWGRWGADDERGALNHLDPATVLGGIGAARTGTVYPLGLPVGRRDQPTLDYRGPAQRLTLTNHTDKRMLEQFGGGGDVGSCEDVLIIPSHNATHMDALSHVYCGEGIYNGYPADNSTAYEGAARCGIEHVGAVVTRGVLVDVAGHQGVDSLEAGHAISVDELRAAMDAQSVELRAGDAVLVRTGWVEQFYATGQEMSLEQPGIGIDVARMLGDADVTLVGADNTAVEAMPYRDGHFMEAHVELLARRGIYLVEHLDLSALARDGCHEFLFVATPLRVIGASASPVNPVAIA